MARRAPLAALALTAACLLVGGAEPALFLGKQFPLETSVSFPAALLHWLDSLTQLSGGGWTAGKTVEAHRQDYVDLLGPPTAEDRAVLVRYGEVRAAFVSRHPEDRDALTSAFFGAGTLDDAFTEARSLLEEQDRATFEQALLHFAEHYRKIWNGGEVPRRFVEDSGSEKRRKALARFLVDVAEFFTVPPDAPPRPRLVLTPVRAGFGTHAQAVDRFLLLEVRPGEGLFDQVAPVVHENAHLLFYKMGTERLSELRSVALARGSAGDEAWRRLKEALPTAIAQGVAQSRFRPDRWSMNRVWYHTESIDAYAKAIFPAVKSALANGRTLDAELVKEFVSIYAGSPASPTPSPETTPRSP